MYVHIGKDFIIPTKEIMIILDLEKMLEKKKIQEILKELKIENTSINMAEGNEKSLILVEKQKKVQAYISNISSLTLAKRIKKEGI